MPLPRHLFTPAFRTQHLGRSFAVIVGIMVFVATFATAAETGLLAMSYKWGQTMESRVTVQIPPADDESGMSQTERVKQAVSILRGLPGVETVTSLSDDDVEKLLQPWFNEPRLLKTLPLPSLIDVERRPGSDLTAARIQDSLKSTISDAHVDDHGAWTQDVWRLVRGLSILGGITITLTGITLAIAVGLVCRAVTAAEHETISLLHMLGTDDRDIARHFQSQAERLAWRASASGFFAAAAVTATLMFVTRHVADFAALDPLYWGGLVIGTCLVPIGAIIISTMTARFSVIHLLKLLP